MATRKVKQNTPPAEENKAQTTADAATTTQTDKQDQVPTPSAAPPAPPAKKSPVKALSVASRVEGFRRAGRAWSKSEITVALADLTDEQVAQLKAEPLLTVTEIELAAE